MTWRPDNGQHVIQGRSIACNTHITGEYVQTWWIHTSGGGACVFRSESLQRTAYCCLCILIVVYVFLDAATLTEVFPCFFLGCKANARIILAKTGHGPHSSKIVVLFYVLLFLYCSMYCFVCKCVLPPGDNPTAVNKYTIYETKRTNYTRNCPILTDRVRYSSDYDSS